MGRFTEQKRSKIEAGREQGDAGLKRGEQRYEQLRNVKSIIDSLSLQDDGDTRQIVELKNQYRQAGIEAHDREVKSVVDSARGDLEHNKSDISAERSNVEKSVDKVGDMQGRTDLARNKAKNVEKGLRQSVEEYKEMENKTENIEHKQEQHSHDILRRIENLFG